MSCELKLRKITAGVIGCGKSAEFFHLPGYLSDSSVQLKAITDVDSKRLSLMSRKFHVQETFIDYHDLLGKGDIDVVSVCTPTVLHHEMVLEAAKQGKHILCEKPLALNVSQAEEMIEVARKHKVQLYVGFQRRFAAVIREMMKLYRSGYVRNPISIDVKFSEFGPPKGSWYYDRSRGGGALFDSGQHPLDLLLHNFGEGQLSSASFAHAAGTDVDEMATLVLNYGDDSKGIVEVDWKPNGVPKLQLTLKGAISYMSADILHSTLDIKSNDTVLGRTIDQFTLHFDDRIPLSWAQAWEFVESVRSERRSERLATGEQALQALKTIEDAYKRFWK